MKTLDIAIVGYGTAGQAAALALSADGHRVEVFERAPQPGPVGAGFLLQPTGLAALWQLGLLDEALRYGVPIARLYGDLINGRAVMDMRYRQLDAHLFGLGMQRGALFEILRTAWGGGALRAGREIVDVDAARGVLREAGGASHGPFDLVIAADGAGSRLRTRLGARHTDTPYPWGALWCLLPQGDWRHTDQLRQRYRGAERMIGVLPVGTRPGDATTRVSFFWSLRTRDFDAWRQRDLAAWRADVLALWPELEALLAPLSAPDQLATAGYRDVILGDRWHRGRLVAIGDAAHAMSPQLGQGVNMALLDALALRAALRAERTLDAQLSSYAIRRRDHVAVYQFWSRWLTPMFQSDSRLAARLRDLALLPLGKLPGGRGNMLRVLTGTRRGLLGTYGLEPAFLRALDERASRTSTPALGPAGA